MKIRNKTKGTLMTITIISMQHSGDAIIP